MEQIIVTTKQDIEKIVESVVVKYLPNFTDSKTRFNLEQAAEYTGLAVPTFRLHQNKIGGVKIGKRWSFSKSELDSFLESNRRKTLQEIKEAV